VKEVDYRCAEEVPGDSDPEERAVAAAIGTTHPHEDHRPEVGQERLIAVPVSLDARFVNRFVDDRGARRFVRPFRRRNDATGRFG
jgi:hypothetical protein